jgi:glycosyltransferase involved in cell wall biosynthesis
MNNIKFSIVIPVYNVGKYLRKCFDSVVAQTYTNYEVIAVDDGSTDGSGDVCDEYAAKYDNIRVIHKVNGGVADTRNTGLDNARGDYVGFMDADDYLIDSHLFENAAKCLSRSDADVLQYYYLWQTKDNEAPEFSKADISRKKVLNSSLLGGIEYLSKKVCFKKGKFYFLSYTYNVWDKFYKRETIEKNGIRFRTDIMQGLEDCMFNIDVSRYIRCVDVYPYYVYSYIIHTASISSVGIHMDESAYLKWEYFFSQVKHTIDTAPKKRRKLMRMYASSVFISRIYRLMKNNTVGFTPEFNKVLKYDYMMKYAVNPFYKLCGIFYKVFGRRITRKALRFISTDIREKI